MVGKKSFSHGERRRSLYRKAFELGRELFCHGAWRGSLSSQGGPHPPSKIGTRGPHYTQEDRDGDPHSPGRMGTGVPILPGEWEPGVPDKGDPQNFMTPVSEDRRTPRMDGPRSFCPRMEGPPAWSYCPAGQMDR